MLKKAGLAQVVAFDEAAAGAISAAALSRVDPRMALPALALRANGETWRPQRDLLNSDRFALEFVVETEIDSRGDARARLRFGDSVLGRQPAAGTRFVCEFRLGGGSSGNVGADAVTRAARSSGRQGAQSTAGPWRRRSRGRVAGKAVRAAGVPHAGARGHRGRLRRRGPASSRRAARRLHTAMDGHVPHHVHHRRPARRQARDG